MKERIIADLNDYNQNQWNEFIWLLSNEMETQIPTEVLGDNLAKKLMSLYRAITKFNKKLLSFYYTSIVYNLRTVNKIQNNAEIIYVFLYVIHETRPILHRKTIHKILQDGNLKGLEYGSDNLQELLIKALINMETADAPILHDTIIDLKLKTGYSLYLTIFYFSYIGFEEKALENISNVLTSKKTLGEDFYFNFSIAMKDTIPKYIGIRKLLIYLIKNKISIKQNKRLNSVLGEFISNLIEKTSIESRSYILFLEDYFNLDDANASGNPDFIDELSTKDLEISSLISDYYSDDRLYNRPEISIKELTLKLMKNFSHN